MKKSDFDPYQWAKGDYCIEPHQNPGELIGSCMNQAGDVIKSRPDGREMQEQALRIINLAASAITEGEWSKEESGLPDELAESIRASLVRMYVLGDQACRLSITTNHSAEGYEQAINDLARHLASETGRKAADARHNKPGGSRERRARIRAIWASGKFSSRDICAEQEWEDLGYGSFSAARKALRNTEDPA